jgi:hypothetical protein
LSSSASFIAQWQAILVIKTVGTYNFATTSNAGSIVAIDNATVVTNDNCHTADVRKSGQIWLSGGNHTLSVLYFKSGGAPSINLTYSGPDTNGADAVVTSDVAQAIVPRTPELKVVASDLVPMMDGIFDQTGAQTVMAPTEAPLRLVNSTTKQFKPR